MDHDELRVEDAIGAVRTGPGLVDRILTAGGRAMFEREHPDVPWDGLKDGQRAVWVRMHAPAARAGALVAFDALSKTLQRDGRATVPQLACVLCPVNKAGCTCGAGTASVPQVYVVQGLSVCECHLYVMLEKHPDIRALWVEQMQKLGAER